jgi:hypothetical protein
MPHNSWQQAIQTQRALLNEYLRHSLSTYMLDLPTLLTQRKAVMARIICIMTSFLAKVWHFWFGGTVQVAEACVPKPLDYAKLDALIDELAGGI